MNHSVYSCYVLRLQTTNQHYQYLVYFILGSYWLLHLIILLLHIKIKNMSNFFPFSLAIFDFCAGTFCCRSLSHFISFQLFLPRLWFLYFSFFLQFFFFNGENVQFAGCFLYHYDHVDDVFSFTIWTSNFFRFSLFFKRKKIRCLVECHNDFCSEYWQLVIVLSFLNIFPRRQPSLSFVQFASFLLRV